MGTIIKAILLVIFAFVVFGKSSFPSTFLYWLSFPVMFALVLLWWVTEYWISEKKAKSYLKNDIQSSFFAGMVSQDVKEDLKHGRLCICKDQIKFLAKTRQGLTVIWSAKIDDIKSVGIGKVFGIKDGLTITLDDSETSFASKKAEEIQKAILK